MKKESWKRDAFGVVLSFVVPFFTAFVFQSLWNWFVVRAINASELSYWHAFGLGLFVFLLRGWRDDAADNAKNQKVALILLNACVPENKQEETKAALEELDEKWVSQLGMESIKAGAGFCVLIVGWGIHTFLM